MPAVSKIFEVAINNIKIYFETTKILSGKQYEYRKRRSANTAVMNLSKSEHEVRNKGIYVEIVSCDLSKAFGTVNHILQQQKLAYYGITGIISVLFTK